MPASAEPEQRMHPGGAAAPGMLSRGRLIALAGATLLGIGLLGATDPLARVHALLTDRGATMRLQPAAEDPRTRDTAHGENLLAAVAAVPAPGTTQRIVVIGNSQQYSASLPRGARPDAARRVRLTSDLFAGRLEAAAAGQFSVYNASAPNQTLVEALWQGLYWFRVAPAAPDVLLLQASFDMFRQTGIRPGFQTLLAEPAFVSALDAWLAEMPGRPYAGDIAAARRAFAERRAAGTDGQEAGLEAKLRGTLALLPLYSRRGQLRASFLNTLYAARVQLLGISPTTRRHITGQPFNQNMAALTDLIQLARGRQATVLLYNAPVNPSVSLFYADEYRQYLERLRQLGSETGSHFTDLADAVPPGQWGYWIDGPDPIHVDESGHVTIADRLFAAFGPVLQAG